MKTKKILITGIIAMSILATPLFAAYTPPTDDELQELLTNPDSLETLLADASGQEASELMVRIIQVVNDGNATEAQRMDIIASFTANIALALPQSEQNEYATSLIASTGPGSDTQMGAPSRQAVIYAALSAAVPESSLIRDTLTTSAGENQIFQNAVTNPVGVLGENRYEQIIRKVTGFVDSNDRGLPRIGVLGGQGEGQAAIQPLPVPTREPAPAPPPVPAPYDGQG